VPGAADVPLDMMLELETMRTRLVASPRLTEAACAVCATSPSVSMDGCLAPARIPGTPPPLTISLRNCRIISFALSKSAESCLHSLVFSSS